MIRYMTSKTTKPETNMIKNKLSQFERDILLLFIIIMTFVFGFLTPLFALYFGLESETFIGIFSNIKNFSAGFVISYLIFVFLIIAKRLIAPPSQ